MANSGPEPVVGRRVVQAGSLPVTGTWGPRGAVYGWVLAGLCFLALLGSTGQRAAFGAYVTALERAFGASRAEVSLVSSVSLVVYGLGLPLAGRLAEQYGARMVLAASMALLAIGCGGAYLTRTIGELTLAYGVVASLGFAGASNVTIAVAVAHAFRERRGFVMGLAVSGQAVGQMLLVPLTIFLVHTVGWRLSLVVMGLGFLLLTPVFAFWFDERQSRKDAVTARQRAGGAKAEGAVGVDGPGCRDAGQRRGGQAVGVGQAVGMGQAPTPAEPGWLTLARDGRIWLLVVPYFICGFTDIGLIRTHFIPLAEGRGFSPEVIAAAISLLAAVTLGSTIASGYLTDRVRLGRLLSGVYLVRALAIGLLYFAQTPALLMAFAVLDGITDLATITPTSVLCTRLYGERRAGSVFGTVSAFHQIGAAAGSFVPGLLYEATGGYEQALVLSVAMLVVAGALSSLVERQPARSVALIGVRE